VPAQDRGRAQHRAEPHDRRDRAPTIGCRRSPRAG
jgi:hypothetical protein